MIYLSVRKLLPAPTGGVTAVNIDAKTVHSGLDINCKGHFFSLNDQQKFSLRNELLEVRLILLAKCLRYQENYFYSSIKH